MYMCVYIYNLGRGGASSSKFSGSYLLLVTGSMDVGTPSIALGLLPENVHRYDKTFRACLAEVA